MEFSFKAEVVLTLEHSQNDLTSKHVATDFNLEVSKNMDAKSYLDSDGLPTKDGAKVLTTVLIQGLIGNIHNCHEKGFRDSAEHLRYIISELERGFVAVVHT